jgi:hypothetical protein
MISISGLELICLSSFLTLYHPLLCSIIFTRSIFTSNPLKTLQLDRFLKTVPNR